jgi:hypothetical protein
MPCGDNHGLDRDEVEFLNYIKPELKRLAEGFPKPEVARRFGLSIDHDRPKLPPGKVLVQTHRPKIVDRDHATAFGCFCCIYNPWTGECEYCCYGFKEKKGQALLWGGITAAVAILAVGLFCRGR